jgi:hypothetical protein
MMNILKHSLHELGSSSGGLFRSHTYPGIMPVPPPSASARILAVKMEGYTVASPRYRLDTDADIASPLHTLFSSARCEDVPAVERSSVRWGALLRPSGIRTVLRLFGRTSHVVSERISVRWRLQRMTSACSSSDASGPRQTAGAPFCTKVRHSLSI